MKELKDFLDEKVLLYNNPDFIPDDPISIPHRYSHTQDREISGLFAAVLAWGQRKTIISKCQELMQLMGDTPYDFIINHKESDLKPFLDFKHRTFNATDTLYFIHWLRWFYSKHTSLEEAFKGQELEQSISSFYRLFFSLDDHPTRTRKHIQTPEKKSACKRLNMFLRWMVRQDDNGVDFGIWKSIKPSQLICPLDLHVDRVARRLGLVERKSTDWTTALELTKSLRKLDPQDPVKYDFALFGLGIIEKI